MTAIPRTADSRVRTGAAAIRFATIAATAFLTLVDLFAAQAILPFLTAAYGVTPAAMSFAVNASTIGMAAGGLAVALFRPPVSRRTGILLCLSVLTIPTLLLSLLPPLPVFTLLRICQGVCMSAAFAQTLAYLGERAGPRDSAAAFAAYVTGNVASNLIGRLVSAGVADHFGLSANFQVFALLNLTGAVLVWFTVEATPKMALMREPEMAPRAAWMAHLRDPRLLAGFVVGFCLLFAFIGIFTFVNFVLAGPSLGLGMMQIGYVCFVFLPSVFSTPLAGTAAARIGTRAALWGALAVAVVGLPLLLTSNLTVLIAGLVLVAVGTFAAQAIATGYVSRTAKTDRGAASGLYLASYFSGGLAGSIALGQIFQHAGWGACVAGVGGALLAAAAFTIGLRPVNQEQEIVT